MPLVLSNTNTNTNKTAEDESSSSDYDYDDDIEPEQPWEERLAEFAGKFYIQVDGAASALRKSKQQQAAAAAMKQQSTSAAAAAAAPGTTSMLQAAFDNLGEQQDKNKDHQYDLEAASAAAAASMATRHRLLETFDAELTSASKLLAGKLEDCHTHAVTLLRKAQETQQNASPNTSKTTKTADTSSTSDDDDDEPPPAGGDDVNLEAMFKDAEAFLSIASSDFDLRMEAEDLQGSFADVQAVWHRAIETFQNMAAYADSQLLLLGDSTSSITATTSSSYSKLVHEKLGAGKSTTTTTSAAAAAPHQNLISLVILLLSDIFECLRQIEEQQELLNANNNGNKKWEAPSTFERTTTKYWIQDSKLNHVLSHVVKEAPLLVYGQKGSMITVNKKELLSLTATKKKGVDDDDDEEEILFADSTPKRKCRGRRSDRRHHHHQPRQVMVPQTISTPGGGDSSLPLPPHLSSDMLWDKLATPISSVYFDSQDMDLYRERIKRSEGAQLFRVRWYGHKKPVGVKPVFLELKTHHEKWINSKSVKERVTIQEQDMKIFLDTNESNSLASWSDDSMVPYEMVKKGSPGKFEGEDNEEELNKAVDLLRRMRELVLEKKLRPCVRSTYLRAAFQSSSNNALRLTIDRNVTLIDETVVERHPEVNNNNNDSSAFTWCLSDTARVDPQNVVKRVPFPVFEVKLAGDGEDMPEGIADLIEDETVILEATKFSKFLTGAAGFQQDHIESLPYWAENEHFKTIFFKQPARPAAPEPAVAPTADGTSGVPSSSTGNGGSYFGVINDLDTNTGEVKSDTYFGDINDIGRSEAEGRQRRSSKDSKMLDSSTHSSVSFGSLRSSDTYSSQFGASASRRRKGGRRSMDSAISITSDLVGFRSSKSTSGASKKGDDKSKKSAVRPKRPARVEPKSYFANERTFIQWISAALLLVTIAVIVLENSKHNSHAQSVAIFLIAAAAGIVLYSMFVYNRRLFLLATGSPYGYVDRCGPLFLALCVLGGVAVLLVHVIRGDQPLFGASVDGNNYLVEGDGCFLHRVDVNDFFYQASDMFVDEDRNLLLVPSMAEISGIDRRYDHEKSAQTQQLLNLEDADLEAITYTDDGRIFAVSEGKYGVSELLQLSWAESAESSTHRLVVDHMWYITSDRSEGITFVPETNGPGKLYIAHNNVLAETPDNIGGIHIYDLPDPEVETTPEAPMKRIRKLNKKTISFGLRDSKVAGMNYHDGKLYVLHDNSNVIRVWTVETGKLVQEITLPAIEGASWQWEGFFFERRSEGLKKSGNIRGSSTTTGFDDDANQQLLVEGEVTNTILHLALDSPPQVWSIAVNENTETGSIEYPLCARTAPVLPF